MNNIKTYLSLSSNEENFSLVTFTIFQLGEINFISYSTSATTLIASAINKLIFNTFWITFFLLLSGYRYLLYHSVFVLALHNQNESLLKTWENFAQQRGGEDEVREALRKLIEHSILASHRDPPGQPEKGPANPPLGLTSPCEHANVEPAPFVIRSDADPIDGALCASNRWSMDPYSTSGPRAARNRIFHWQLKEWFFLCLPADSIVVLARIVRERGFIRRGWER